MLRDARLRLVDVKEGLCKHRDEEDEGVDEDDDVQEDEADDLGHDMADDTMTTHDTAGAHGVLAMITDNDHANYHSDDDDDGDDEDDDDDDGGDAADDEVP